MKTISAKLNNKQQVCLVGPGEVDTLPGRTSVRLTVEVNAKGEQTVKVLLRVGEDFQPIGPLFVGPKSIDEARRFIRDKIFRIKGRSKSNA